MAKHLQVSFKIYKQTANGVEGTKQEVWINHPDLSAAIYANEQGTGSLNEIMKVASCLVKNLKIGSSFGLELDEIFDGCKNYAIELWDYNDQPKMLKCVEIKHLETA